MITRYEHKFREMYQKVKEEDRGLLEVAKDNLLFFEKEGIGALGIVHHLAEYIKEREKN